MECLVLLIILTISITVSYSSIFLRSVEDHYWRDYQGIVPTDAIPGGMTQDGETTYVGQINSKLSNCYTIPAIVRNGNLTAIAAFGGRTISSSNDNSNIKVLCSQNHQHSYKWHNPLELLEPGCRYVVVGFEEALLHVGKSEVNNETILGKIFSGYSTSVLIIPYEGKELRPKNFTILTYCPSTSNYFN